MFRYLTLAFATLAAAPAPGFSPSCLRIELILNNFKTRTAMPNVQYIIRIATTCTLLSCFVRFCNLRVAYHPPQKTSPSAAAFAHLWRTCQIAKFRRVMSCNSYQTYEILPHSISEGEFDIKFRRKIIMLLLIMKLSEPLTFPDDVFKSH